MDGIIDINQELDVTSRLVQTPVLPDISSLIAAGCRDYKGSSFIVTGRGGKPASPDEPLIPESVAVIDWVELPDLELEAESNSRGEINFSQLEMFQFTTPIVEATGYMINPDCRVILTADRGTFNLYNSAFMPPVCPTEERSRSIAIGPFF